MTTNLLVAMTMVLFLLILFLMCRLQQSRERINLRNGIKPSTDGGRRAAGVPRPPPPSEKIKFYYV